MIAQFPSCVSSRIHRRAVFTGFVLRTGVPPATKCSGHAHERTTRSINGTRLYERLLMPVFVGVPMFRLLLSVVVVDTAQCFVVPSLCSARTIRRTQRPECMAVPYDKTKEVDYPHPHDDDYQFGGTLPSPCTLQPSQALALIYTYCLSRYHQTGHPRHDREQGV